MEEAGGGAGVGEGAEGDEGGRVAEVEDGAVSVEASGGSAASGRGERGMGKG